VKIEFELESRNFLRHMHDPAKCDIIVCWEHNWPECPLEVIELKKMVRQKQIFTTETRRHGEEPELKSKSLPLIDTDDTDEE
jgi:hypothetical protein